MIEWVTTNRGLDCNYKKSISTIVWNINQLSLSNPDRRYEYEHDHSYGVNKNPMKDIKLNIPKVKLKDKKTKKKFINFLNIFTKILKK